MRCHPHVGRFGAPRSRHLRRRAFTPQLPGTHLAAHQYGRLLKGNLAANERRMPRAYERELKAMKLRSIRFDLIAASRLG
jgi:hypothetical protein